MKNIFFRLFTELPKQIFLTNDGSFLNYRQQKIDFYIAKYENCNTLQLVFKKMSYCKGKNCIKIIQGHVPFCDACIKEMEDEETQFKQNKTSQLKTSKNFERCYTTKCNNPISLKNKLRYLIYCDECEKNNNSNINIEAEIKSADTRRKMFYKTYTNLAEKTVKILEEDPRFLSNSKKIDGCQYAGVEFYVVTPYEYGEKPDFLNAVVDHYNKQEKFSAVIKFKTTKKDKEIFLRLPTIEIESENTFNVYHDPSRHGCFPTVNGFMHTVRIMFQI